jgi:hypothetical protein
VDEKAARAWAAESGIGDKQFSALVEIANTGPGVAEAFDLWRRGTITEGGFRRAAKRAAIETEWVDALVGVKDRLLSVAEIATAVQQGHVPPGDLLPPPVTGSPPFTIPLTQIDIDPVTEASGSGFTEERLRVMANLAGLPPGDIELLQMWNRGIVDETSVEAGIREGHRKTKWIPAVKELRWAILSPIQYVEARLRGWITDPEMYAGGLKSGMRKPEMDLLFKTHGRPISFRQTFIGRQRGGELDGPTDAIDPAFLASLRRSNIQPSFYNLAWAQRYTYPSAFVLRALTSSGDITQARAEQVLLYEGWEPGFAKQVSSAWAGGTHSQGKQLVKAELLDEFEGGFINESELRDHLAALGYQGPELDLEVHLADARRIKAWRDKAVTALGKVYVGGTMTQTTADGYLTELGLTDADTRGRIIGIWDIEREFK